MTTLTNSFHNSTTHTRMSEADMQQLEREMHSADAVTARIAKHKIKQIRNRLCGIDGCTCGDTFGRRS